MSFIAEITLENYRSFRRAHCRLAPFTLIVGANNAGKSNLLRAVRDVGVSDAYPGSLNSARHQCSGKEDVKIVLRGGDGGELAVNEHHDGGGGRSGALNRLAKNPGAGVPVIYRLDPAVIGGAEKRTKQPFIAPNGEGVSAVLDKLNAGHQPVRKRYSDIIAALCRCVPEIEHVSFFDVDEDKRAIQVEQAGLSQPCPLSEVSDGTRLILAILTLVNMENPPPVLLLEDIDRGLHPRLYEQLVEFLRGIAKHGHTQILATTHDPYLIDEFRETPEAVVIVEKKDGASTLANLDEHLSRLRTHGADLDMPLGQLWFSGMVGGVPGARLPEILKVAEE
ncbi:MAG: AAA family ATPase [Chthoniobacteraceae bacterium]